MAKKSTFVAAPINADAMSDIMSILEDAMTIEHPTMEDSSYGQFLALGAKYTAARNVIDSSQFLDYLSTQPATEDRASRIRDVERRIEASRFLYQQFDQMVGSLDINANADEMVDFFSNPSAQIQESTDTEYADLVEQAEMLGTDVDEIIAAEELQTAKRIRQSQDRAERAAKYAVNNKDKLMQLLVHSVRTDHLELTDQELLAYVNKFSLKIGNPPSQSKTADNMGYKFKANELFKDAKRKYEQVKNLNPILAAERQAEMAAAKKATFSLAALEKHINEQVVKLSQSVDEFRRMTINAREGIEMY